MVHVLSKNFCLYPDPIHMAVKGHQGLYKMLIRKYLLDISHLLQTSHRY